MKIVLPKFATNYNLCPIKTEQEANAYGTTYNQSEDDDYVLYWGVQSSNKLHQSKKIWSNII